MNLILESKNLQEQEGELPSSKGEQERIKGDLLRRETQRISTLCLNMLTQECEDIQVMWEDATGFVTSFQT